MSATPGENPEPETARPEEERGGDPACWLNRVCPRCGTFADTTPPTVCPQCHTPIPAA